MPENATAGQACPEPTAQELSSCLLATFPLLHEQMKRILSVRGLYSAPKMAVINLLAHGSKTQAVLIEMTRMPASAMSKLIDSLEQQGVVRRTIDAADRRRMIIELSAEGQEVRRDLKKRMFGYLAEKMGDLSREERQTIIDACNILSQAFVVPASVSTPPEIATEEKEQ